MTQQLDFFGSRERLFVDDGETTIAYYPDVFDAAESAALFEYLLRKAPWQQERMWMYDHEVDCPRLNARFPGFADVPEVLRNVHGRVETYLDTRFNSVSLNLYRNERDSVAWHNDHLNELVDRPVIALLSLGAIRPMLIRSKSRPRKTFECDLAPGSLMVMGGRSQELWEHHIPKFKRPVGPRISVAFRQRP